MNTHPYTLSKLNGQRVESLQLDSRMAIASKGSRVNIIRYLQNLYAQVKRHDQSQTQDPCCAQH
ncbi:hypothetical protein [Sutcliffiella horikoshii]|uniref:hypothetical protein n=1 Tax=Sutcliffiella horikoshii TaxID=79883 RepID=UPI001F31D2AB|nr:hypothetical protein [Sutcliffiella horikoshii]MCG1021974.1 hypothetical protein [Sutcliffiella horikoshii]